MADLRTELQKPAYSGLTDAECAALLNTRDQDGPVPCADVVRYLLGQGVWTAVKTSAPAMTDALAILPAVEVADQPWFGAQINALVTATVLSAAQRTALFNLPKNRRTRGEALGFGTVKVGHVAAARA